MADKTIGDLPQAAAFYDEDLFLLEQSGTAKNMRGALLKAYLKGFVDAAEAASEEAAAALAGVREAINNIPEGAATPIVNDLTTGGTSMALSAEQGKKLKQELDTRVNPNLLDNWYFGNPVNQRGKTEYASAGYSIDRWTAASAERVAIVSGGIQLSFSGLSRQFLQYIDNGAELFGKTVTLSVLSEAGLGVISIAIPQAPSTGTIGKGADVLSGVQVYLRYSGATLYVSFYSSSSYQMGTLVLIKAAKLELGTQQTLAHQDDEGNWVLNEIPDYGLELIKCQRYYQLFSSEASRPTSLADYRPAMRVTPATGTIDIDGTTYYYADANL